MTDPNPAEDKQQFLDEIVWAVRRIRVLLKYWTMPLLTDTKPSGSDDVVSARAFALLIIVALTFAVRGAPLGGTMSYTVLASGVAAAASIGLNLLSKTTKISVSEPALVSAYASTILVMLGFLVIRAFDSTHVYSAISDYIGDIPTAVCFSVVAIYILLLAKALFWDKNRSKLSLKSALGGLGVTLGSGFIVYVIYFISGAKFDELISFFCSLSNSACLKH